MSKTQRPSISHFIFIASDCDVSRLSKPSAYQVAKYRLQRRQWGLGLHTRNRNALRPGDAVIIYVSGQRESGRQFIASCTVASQVKGVNMSVASAIDAPNHDGNVSVVSAVQLKDIQFFNHPVPVATLKQKLHFIKKPDSPKWGAYLQGGVKRISGRDYELILRRGAKGP
jgi:hypothetical protein